ncbi:M20 family metallopeptidase [Gudongella sp. SC589]|uniref:M20 family metallopeptidase n=1 Tax=Gudongella sp. SC589 TaxID=3385990 RepID=UPI0039048D06
MKELIRKYHDEIISLNDFMADNPEIGGEEQEASRRMVELLRRHGIPVEYPFAGMETAFRGIINKGKARKAAILVEYDALRGLGHACGHCASGSISILAALVLNEVRDQIPAEIHVIGTPDEEMHGGKVPMVKSGVFDGMDFAVMIHMSNKNALFSRFLALDAYKFTFHGKPAHASSIPWEGRNALNSIRLFFDAMDMMRQHLKDDVRLHGYVVKGGDASNIVPHHTEAEVLVRAEKREYLDQVSKWVMDCAQAAALATRTSWSVEEIGEKYDSLRRNISGEKILEEIYTELGLNLVDTSSETGGSSDIGNVSSVCPAFHPYLDLGKDLNAHTEEFALAMKTNRTHKAISLGGEIISRFVMDVYNTPGAREEILKEYGGDGDE